jgi:hypothetical protein
MFYIPMAELIKLFQGVNNEAVFWDSYYEHFTAVIVALLARVFSPVIHLQPSLFLQARWSVT